MLQEEFCIPIIFFQRPEWDKFPGAVHTYAADTMMPDGKALQQPSTHLLGQNFAKSFNIRFKDKDEKEKVAWQTCYGPAIWRMFSSVVALHGDDKGLVFPFKIAPMQVAIIPIGGTEKEAYGLQKELMEAGIRVIVDASDNTPGWKFNQWEMKGVPIRIELGPKEVKEGRLTLVRRDTGKKTQVNRKAALKSVLTEGGELTKSIISKADNWFAGKISNASSMKELGECLKSGGFVRTELCSVGKDGEACADRIKDRFHAEVRGKRIDVEEKPKGDCVVCGSKAQEVVYVAKQY